MSLIFNFSETRLSFLEFNFGIYQIKTIRNDNEKNEAGRFGAISAY